jgi:hypothetical protein
MQLEGLHGVAGGRLAAMRAALRDRRAAPLELEPPALAGLEQVAAAGRAWRLGVRVAHDADEERGVRAGVDEAPRRALGALSQLDDSPVQPREHRTLDGALEQALEAHRVGDALSGERPGGPFVLVVDRNGPLQGADGWRSSPPNRGEIKGAENFLGHAARRRRGGGPPRARSSAMQGTRKKGAQEGPVDQSSSAAKAAGGRADAGASALKMGRALGNEELQKRIEKGNATRDELLTYMNQRLGAINEAQRREHLYGSEHMREDWMRISDKHKPEFAKPEPLRWHESAKLYEMALYQLCRGSLGRGAELLEKAMTAERKAFEQVGDQTGAKELEPEEEAAGALPEVLANQACAPCDIPAEIQEKIDKIQADQTEFKDQPNRRRVADPWWTLDEEEEEEAKPADGG